MLEQAPAMSVQCSTLHQACCAGVLEPCSLTKGIPRKKGLNESHTYCCELLLATLPPVVIGTQRIARMSRASTLKDMMPSLHKLRMSAVGDIYQNSSLPAQQKPVQGQSQKLHKPYTSEPAKSMTLTLQAL
jgi:hypothetical protein